MQDIVGPVRQKPYIQGAGPSLSEPREQLPGMKSATDSDMISAE
jgi:hypothetical protein